MPKEAWMRVGDNKMLDEAVCFSFWGKGLGADAVPPRASPGLLLRNLS